MACGEVEERQQVKKWNVKCCWCWMTATLSTYLAACLSAECGRCWQLGLRGAQAIRMVQHCRRSAPSQLLRLPLLHLWLWLLLLNMSSARCKLKLKVIEEPEPKPLQTEQCRVVSVVTVAGEPGRNMRDQHLCGNWQVVAECRKVQSSKWFELKNTKHLSKHIKYEISEAFSEGARRACFEQHSNIHTCIYVNI